MKYLPFAGIIVGIAFFASVIPQYIKCRNEGGSFVRGVSLSGYICLANRK